MKKKKKKKLSLKKIRLFFVFIIFSIVTGILIYNCLSNIKLINDMKEEKKVLEDKIVVLQEEKESLENDILKLKDPDYIAKYVREKYYFSKDGELILKMDK